MTLHKYFRGCLVVTALVLAGGGRSVALRSTSSSARLLADPKASLADNDATRSSASTENAIRTLRRRGEYESLMAAVEKSRYRVTAHERELMPGAGGEYMASNYAQGLRASFDGMRLEVTTDTAGKALRWGLQLAGYGYGQALVTPSAAEVSVTKNRIEYRHSRVRGQETGLTEWYVNRAEGIEQGFTLAAPPAGKTRGTLLHLELATSGDFQGRMAEEGRAIEFVGPAGAPVLRYQDLQASDSCGKELPARLGIQDGRLSLFVDDSEAVYPVMIDPLIFKQTKLTSSDVSENDSFGSSVAIDGDTVVVGAPWDSFYNHSDAGSAYVYVYSGGNWTEQAHFLVSDGNSHQYGASVAIDGNTVVVGARWDTTAAGLYVGSAYVYVRQGNTWSQQAHLFASDGAQGDNFGTSVGVSANVVVVGAPFDDTAGGSRAGSAYVYVRSGNSWMQQAHLFASAAGPKNWFGYSVDVDGDTVVVGSPLDDANLFFQTNSGSAYVYRFIRGGWHEQAHFTSRGADEFGWSVAIGADTLVVGAPDIDVIEEALTSHGPGSAYVYVRSEGAWSQQAHLLASEGADGDGYGMAVALDGDVAVVGAPYGGVTSAGDQAGSSYVYTRSASDWSEQAHLSASDGATRDHFGRSVALFGWTIVVGAPGDDALVRPATLSAYVFKPMAWFIPVP